MIEREDKSRYTSVRGLFTLSYPETWSLTSEEQGIVSLSDRTESAAVTVSAAKHESEAFIADACQQLRRYVSQFSSKVDRLEVIECSPALAIGEYVSPAGDYWRVQFKASRNIVVFATYSVKLSDRQTVSDSGAMAILDSITIMLRT